MGENETAWRILPVGDFHIGVETDEEGLHPRYDEYVRDEKDAVERKLTLWRLLTDSINALDLDYVVFLGDNFGKFSEANCEVLKDLFKDLRCPVIGVMGNHDAGQRLADGTWPPDYWLERRKRISEDVFGHDVCAGFDLRGGWRLILLNNATPIARDRYMFTIADEDLSFLESELARGLPCVTVMHVPFRFPKAYATMCHRRIYEKPADQRRLDSIPRQFMYPPMQEKLNALRKKHANWRGNIAGHVHYYACDEEDGFTQWTFPIWPERSDPLRCLDVHDF